MIRTLYLFCEPIGLAWLSLQEGYTGCVITHDLQMLSTDAFDAHLVA